MPTIEIVAMAKKQFIYGLCTKSWAAAQLALPAVRRGAGLALESLLHEAGGGVGWAWRSFVRQCPFAVLCGSGAGQAFGMSSGLSSFQRKPFLVEPRPEGAPDGRP